MDFFQKILGSWMGKHDPDTDSSSSEDENNVTVVEQKRKTITEEDLTNIEVKREGTSLVWSAPDQEISHEGTIDCCTYSF